MNKPQWGDTDLLGRNVPAKPCETPIGVDNPFSNACCDRTRSNGFKLNEGRFRLDIRKKFFTVRVVKHWHRLPGEVVEALCLETFKARLDGALRNLV